MKQEDMGFARLKEILEEWANWQQGYKMKIGYPSVSAGFIPGGYVSKTFDEMADDNDQEISRLVDYAIDDLIPVQAAAIYRCYLGAIFRLNRIPYETALLDAHITLLHTLPEKGVVVR